MTLHRKRSAAISYVYSRLNSTTYVVIQKDKYNEYPFIYVKIYIKLQLAVVIDTGCGAQSCADDDAPAKDLKDFIEIHLLHGEAEQSRPYEYTVICTHCHFDHIGGIESFARANSTIVASGHDKAFVSPENLPENSLCTAFGMATPIYAISSFPADGEWLYHGSEPLGLRVLHTPGHTPDSLAIYDKYERWLFSGDSCYNRVCDLPWGERQQVPIVFPQQGNWRDFAETLQRLIGFVKDEESMEDALEAAKRGNAEVVRSWRVRIACGHTTSGALAGEFLANVFNFFCKVVAGAVPVVARLPGDKVAPGGSLGDETFVLWQEEGEPEFSMIAPERLKDEFCRRA